MKAKHERLITVPVVLGICIAAIAGTVTVFYQTRVVNATVGEYFSFMTFGRLLILTHVHAFGYATMGFLLWIMGQRHGVERARFLAILLSLTILVGLLDILSWWCVIYINPAFRYLTFAAGGAFVGGILVSGLIVLLACLKIEKEGR